MGKNSRRRARYDQDDQKGWDVMDDKNRTILLAGLFLGLFFSSLDQTVVGTAMPRIIGDLGGLSIMTWVTTAYMLSSTAIVPIAGKLADLYGRRMVYVTGLAVFMLGSALCGLSASMLQLILFRGLQGVGGGIMMPLSMTIVGDVFPPAERGKWQGLIGAVFGLSSILGPAIGGWIVDYSSWHWVFYVNMPIGLLAAASIYIGLRGEKPLAAEAVIDYAGAFRLVTATVTLLLGLNLGGTDYPWISWQILGLLGISLITWTVFILRAKATPDPIISLDLFGNRVFTITNIIGFLQGLGMFGSLMFLPLFLQGVIGISATDSGNSMLPMMLSMVLISIIGGRVVNRVSFRTMFVLGMLLMAGGFFLLSTMTLDTTRGLAMFYILLLGLGMGLVMPTVTLAVQSAFPAQQRGAATSAAQFFRSIGGVFGITLLGVLFNARSRTILEQEFFPLVSGLPASATGPLTAMLDNAHADPHSLFNILLSPATLGAIPAEIQQTILPPLKAALADSLHIVFFAAMGIALAGAAVSWLLGDAGISRQPRRSTLEEAGVTLMAEGMAVEGEIAAELVPDLVEDEREAGLRTKKE